MPPGGRLGDAPHLQALHEPTARLDLAPRHILQRQPKRDRLSRVRAAVAPASATLLVHIAFAAAFFYLLSFRDAEVRREVEIPVELVTAPPEPPKPPPAAPPKPKAPDPIAQALSAPVAPDPKPPAPPSVQPPSPPVPEPTPPTSADVTGQPKLVAAPPAPPRAATQDREAKAANLEPDTHQRDEATHEARPAEAPRTLATADPAASFAVPAPSPPKPDPVPKPAATVPAKVPSEADKLAAALPMDTSAMPMTFRAVLSGNGAQVSAAYKGLVYGRFSRNPEIGERARRQHLKGQVIVAFTIDDTGRLTNLAVLQSSGKPAVDALGLEMIRSAAPFPPPPPDAQRSFTPALSFGE